MKCSNFFDFSFDMWNVLGYALVQVVLLVLGIMMR